MTPYTDKYLVKSMFKVAVYLIGGMFIVAAPIMQAIFNDSAYLRLTLGLVVAGLIVMLFTRWDQARTDKSLDGVKLAIGIHDPNNPGSYFVQAYLVDVTRPDAPEPVKESATVPADNASADEVDSLVDRS